MNIEINIISEKYDFVEGPYKFFDKLIRKSRKQQGIWKKIPRPGAFSIRIEPKDMVTVWKIAEIILFIIFYIYFQFMKLIYFLQSFFKSIFG